MLRIALTGGGTGGHVFPLLAVAESLLGLGRGEIELRYYGPTSPWNREIAARDIRISHVAGAKLRRYASPSNFFDIPKFFVGLLEALFELYLWMPDAVFSKGGPGALPVVLAAAWYRIPVVIHESDAVPGLTNRISGALAARIAVSFEQAAGSFSPRKTFTAGNPVRAAIATAARIGKPIARSQLGLEPDRPVILILGGSQGARVLNDFAANALPVLTEFAAVYHQTGAGNVPVERTAHYTAKEFLDEREMALALAAADVVLTRAGSGAISECAAAGAPSILVPLSHGANDHQRANAREYAATGAAIVIEENNLTPNLVAAEIKKLLADSEKLAAMEERARAFYRPSAAETIAREIVAAAGAKIL